MHNSITSLTSWLWYGTLAAQPILLLIIFWRGGHKKHPWFPRYLVIDFLGSIFLLSVADYKEYVASFYLLAIFTACCKAGVLVGVIHHVFAPYEELPRGTMARLVIGIVSAIGILSGIIFHSHARNLDNSMNFLRTADSALAAAILCGFWIVVIYARKLGLYWRSQTVGVAVGFLFHSSCQTATKIILLTAHPEAAIWVRNIGQLSYLITLLIWMGYMLVPEPAHVLNRKDAEAALAFVESMEERMRRISSAIKKRSTFNSDKRKPNHNVSTHATTKRRLWA